MFRSNAYWLARKVLHGGLFQKNPPRNFQKVLHGVFRHHHSHHNSCETCLHALSELVLSPKTFLRVMSDFYSASVPEPVLRTYAEACSSSSRCVVLAMSRHGHFEDRCSEGGSSDGMSMCPNGAFGKRSDTCLHASPPGKFR